MRVPPWIPLLAALLLAGCASVTNPVTGERELTVMDETAEIAEGTKAHAEVIKEYGVVADAALQAYVDRVGQRLAAVSHRAHLKWTFTALDSPEVNAFALPGGYVYVTRGIMAYLDSEADLAGVLGHEIGHVTARHGAAQATRQARAGAAVAGATILGVIAEVVTGVPGVARTASTLTQAGAAGLIASYSRDQELQADALGAEYLARTRYNPASMVDVIQVLSDQERFAADAAKAAGRAAPTAPGWLASHPSSEQRLQQISATSNQLLGQRPAGWADDGRERYLRSIAGLTFGDGREQGVVRGRHFFHEPLGIAITAPQGFRIVNASDSVSLINGERDAGLVLRTVPASLVQKTGPSHEAVLRQGYGATEGKTEKLMLGGSLPATFFSGQRRDAKGNTGSLNATIASGPGGQLFVLGRLARDAAALERARPALREAELSLRALGAAERAAARPWKIALVPLPAGGFGPLAKNTPLTELAEQQLRLLNGVYGGSALPPVGQLVKVVE